MAALARDLLARYLLTAASRGFLDRMIDICAAPSFVTYMAGWATKIEGSTITPSADLGPGTKFHDKSVSSRCSRGMERQGHA
jgi:phenylacetaldehyde dehydrogenase